MTATDRKTIRAALHTHRRAILALQHMRDTKQSLYEMTCFATLTGGDERIVKPMLRWLEERIETLDHAVNNPPILEEPNTP